VPGDHAQRAARLGGAGFENARQPVEEGPQPPVPVARGRELHVLGRRPQRLLEDVGLGRWQHRERRPAALEPVHEEPAGLRSQIGLVPVEERPVHEWRPRAATNRRVPAHPRKPATIPSAGAAEWSALGIVAPMAPPTLRPLRVGELLDAAITVYRSNAGALIRTVVPFIVPLAVLGALVDVSAAPDDRDGTSFFDSQNQPDLTDREWTIFLTGTGISLLLALIAGVLATAACFKAVSDAYLGGTPDWRSSVRFALARIGPLLWLSLLGAVLNFLGLLALLIPGIYLYVAWSVATPALLAEDVRGRKALGRSWRLVRGRWWPTLGAVVVAFLLVLLVQVAIGAILGGALAATGADDNVTLALVNAVAGIIGGVVATPFQAAVFTLLYIDLRVRKEGLDVELLTRAIAGEAGPGQGPTLIPPPP
jgi:hypothetical protein